MAADLYAALALPMRYAFSILMILILTSMLCWLRADNRRRRRRLDRLPEAGYIGEFIVEAGSDELREGMLVLVPREGVLGFNRTCDVTVPVNGVAACHLDLLFEDGVGLTVRPRRGLTCLVDGQRMDRRAKPRAMPLLHGSRLTVGEAVLCLRVFEGVDIPHHASAQEETLPQGAPVVEAAAGPSTGAVPPVTAPVPPIDPSAPPPWQPMPSMWQPTPQDGQPADGPRAQAYPNYVYGPGVPYVPNGMPHVPNGVPVTPGTGPVDAYAAGPFPPVQEAAAHEAGTPADGASHDREERETPPEPKKKARRDKKADKPPKMRPPRMTYSTAPDFAPDEDDQPVRERRRGRRRSHG